MSLPPPAPNSLPELPGLPRRSRYRRPRRFVSVWGIFLGLILGIGGGLFIGWYLVPYQEFDTAPWQLKDDDKAQYVVAIILAWSHDGDLGQAINRLVALQMPGNDPIQQVADIACNLAKTGYVDSNSGIHAIRVMIQFYELQGRTGCASNLLPNVTPPPEITIVPPTDTPTVAPPPSKTPTPQVILTPTPTLQFIPVPTTVPHRDFVLVNITPYCDVALSGIIEVYVQEFNGDGIPGQAVRVKWDGGESTFFTGLKPERGPAYADFKMEAGKGYIIDMPGRSDPSSRPLAAVQCTTDANQQAIQSYRVVFRPAG